MVLFDLPTGTKKERKRAHGFRMFLLDQGFEMSQFSVYVRFVGDRSNTKPFARKIEAAAPANGKVSILMFTDKQFSDIINIRNREKSKPASEPEQILLF
ncbi:CRISPR-associated endonuclease Cas2 [Sneathiella chinensis]|nr:CRISPR-associated endonuclease Cas2 [Sneathiella chinensis]